MLKRLFANLLDQVVIFAVSALILVVAQAIMKGAGYKITDSAAFLLIFYAVANVLYFPILEGTKGITLGKQILKLND